MSYNIGTDADPLFVLVTFADGVLDAVVRATDAATFEAAARWAELKYEVTETTVDHETGEATTTGTGEWLTAAGVNIDHIGPVVVVAGTYDADGVELTAPTYDTRHHVNIRLMDPALSQRDASGLLKWQKWAAAWSMDGAPDTQINAAEVGKVLQGVCLIDPPSIRSPSRRWAS